MDWEKTPILVMLTALILMTHDLKAQKKWDGEAGDGLWSSAGNWSPDGFPSLNDSVLLDNSLDQDSYSVTLPPGSLTTALTKLAILPAHGKQVTLLIGSTNKASPALSLSNNGECLALGDGAILMNASGATSGETISMAGFLSIYNGGRYTHHTSRAHATILNHLSTLPGTEMGVFEFDVPGNGGYTVSLTGKTFGSLVFSAEAAGGAKSYSGSGVSELRIRGDLILNNGAQLTSSLSANMSVAGQLYLDGNLNLQPSTSGTSNRSLLFQGIGCVMKGKGQLNLGVNFRNLEVMTGSTLNLEHDIDLTRTTHALRIHGKSSLNLGGAVIRGQGSFLLDDSANLYIGSAEGITSGDSGNIRTGTRSLSTLASYIYIGDGDQHTGNSIPPTILGLGVDKPHGDLHLSGSLETSQLSLQRGRIITGTGSLTLAEGNITSPVNSYGKSDQGWEGSYVDGYFSCRRGHAADLVFPVGDAGTYAPFIIHKPGNLPVTYTVAYMAGNYPYSQPIDTSEIERLSTIEYWSVSSAGKSPDHDASISLSWRAGSGMGIGSSQSTSLCIAGLKSDNNGPIWKVVGGSVLVERNDTTGWIHSSSVVTSFMAFTIGTPVKQVVLPTPAISFKCRSTPEGNLLSWSLFDQKDLKECDLEISKNGLAYTTLKSLNFREYSYMDRGDPGDVDLYRLKMTNADGVSNYSNTCRLSKSMMHPLKLYPNPAHDILFLESPVSWAGLEYRITSIEGQSILKGVLSGLRENKILLPGLHPGIYLVNIRTKEGVIIKKFLKH